MKDNPAVLCRDVLTLCDGYGCSLLDSCAWCCTLEKGHGGPHYNEFAHGEETVIIAWHTEPFAVSITSKEE